MYKLLGLLNLLGTEMPRFTIRIEIADWHNGAVYSVRFFVNVLALNYLTDLEISTRDLLCWDEEGFVSCLQSLIRSKLIEDGISIEDIHFAFYGNKKHQDSIRRWEEECNVCVNKTCGNCRFRIKCMEREQFESVGWCRLKEIEGYRCLGCNACVKWKKDKGMK